MLSTYDLYNIYIDAISRVRKIRLKVVHKTLVIQLMIFKFSLKLHIFILT